MSPSVSPSDMAERIRRTLRGPMWHGPSLFEAIGNLDARGASARPIAGAHSVWELVLHVAVWAEVPLRRLRGDAVNNLSTTDDFPPMPSEPSARTWTDALQRLESAYTALAEAVTALPPSAIDAPVVAHDYSVATMLQGVVEHGVYHAGQMVLLRRSLEGAAT